MASKGFTVKNENGEIIIRIPFDGLDLQKLPFSASGKSRNIATTGGNVQVEGLHEQIRLGLNCYWQLPADERGPNTKAK